MNMLKSSVLTAAPSVWSNTHLIRVLPLLRAGSTSVPREASRSRDFSSDAEAEAMASPVGARWWEGKLVSRSSCLGEGGWC